MNLDQLKKNLLQRVQLRPISRQFAEDGKGLKQQDDDWIIEEVSGDSIRISNVRTQHFAILGRDHIHHYTSNPARSQYGLKHGFLILNVQIFLCGAEARTEPNSTPGQPVNLEWKSYTLNHKDIELIDNKLRRISDQHVGELLTITNRLIDNIEPNRNAAIAASLRVIQEQTTEAINRYGDYITHEVTNILAELRADIEEKDKKALMAVLEKYIDQRLYEKRFESFVGAMRRQLSRYGVNVDLQQFGMDLHKSRYDVGTKNALRNLVARLESDLDILVLKKERSQTTWLDE